MTVLFIHSVDNDDSFCIFTSAIALKLVCVVIVQCALGICTTGSYMSIIFICCALWM